MKEPSGFGEVLRRHRVAKALSQESLAARAGLSVRGISDLERGARTVPRLETVGMLADALNLNAEERDAFFTSARPNARSRAPEPAFSPSRLPTPPTPLVGRAGEIAAVIRLLDEPGVRLVTLTGPGGVGKTRLAIAAAKELEASFSAGAHFVELAPVSEPALVASAIADALGVREGGSVTLQSALERFLTARPLLLILDNFEHLLAAAPLVAQLLTACPGLKVISTSRGPLRLRGERQQPVPPLGLPAPGHLPPVDELAEIAAVRLFVARAQDANPAFTLTAENAADVADICRRLDGLPLAIELAAARTHVLPPSALLARLQRLLPLLTGGSQDLPARQQTLRSTIAWSYDLLPPIEQALFRRLAVFAGGWTLEAATAVAAPEGELNTLDRMVSLVATSLVQATPSGAEPRFGMLEMVREYAWEQLIASGETEDVRRRHVEYHLALARAGAADLADTPAGSWLARLEAEQANLRAALDWSRECGESSIGLQLAAALGGFWRLRNTAAEGRVWLEAFLAQPGSAEAPAVDRVAALRWAGELAGLEADLERAQMRIMESLTLARQAGDKRGISAALGAIASATLQGGDVAGSIPLFDEAARLALEVGDRRQGAFVFAYLAYATGQQGNLARAEEFIAESERLVRSLGDARSFEANFATMGHGWLAVMGRDYDRGEALLRESVVQGEEIDNKAMLAAAFSGLGEIGLARGRPDEAARHFGDGLKAGWEACYPPGMCFNLQGIIRVSAQRADPRRVAGLIGALEGMGMGLYAMHPDVVAAYEARVAQVRERLGEAAFTTARAAGRARPQEAAVADALALMEEMSVPLAS